MSIAKEYIEESYGTISRLHDATEDMKYFKRWRLIRESYEQMLNDGVIFKQIAFTPHDYKRHCVGIYRILDWLIPAKAYEGLSFEELFVLDIAVILHDYIMSKDLTLRHEHGQAAEESLTKVFDSESESVLKLGINDVEWDCIGQIIRGHSDIKDKDDPDKIIEETIKSIKKEMVGSYGKIRVKLLAGLLRLADELDICFKRTEGINFQDKYMGEGEEAKKSYKHWRACDIFELPRKSTDNTAISLKPLMKKIIKSPQDIPSIEDIEIVLDVTNKIQKSLNYLNENVFNFEDFTDWRFTKVIVETDNPTLREAIDSKKKP